MVEELTREHRMGVLQYGVAGRLAMRDEVKVVPLDDEKLLADANPVTHGGKMNVDAAKLAMTGRLQPRSGLAHVRSSCWVALTIFPRACGSWAAG